MEKEQKQVLVAKLYNDIKFANQSAKTSEKYKDGLTKEHYHISAFYWFLKTNENLTSKEIREILSSNNRFSFLRKLDNLIPNFFEELKTYGITYVENLYNKSNYGQKELGVKDEQKRLLVELYKKLEQEKHLGFRDKDVIVGGMYNTVRRQLGKPLTITKEEMDQLVALYRFLKEHNDFTQEELNKLLIEDVHKFKFLIKVNNILPDFLNELKDHGPGTVACYYANREHINKEIDKLLP